MPETIWLDGVPGSYHDHRCQCPSHCLNCFDDMVRTREVHNRMVDEGRFGPGGKHIGPKKRYCSDYCQNHAARERALDRRIAASAVKES